MSRMTRFASITSITARLFGAALLLLGSASATAELTVGVSWSNFHEERWKTDEAAIVAELERQGARYVSADAQSSPEKQASDIESLIARGVDALIILPHDADETFDAGFDADIAAAAAEDEVACEHDDARNGEKTNLYRGMMSARDSPIFTPFRPFLSLFVLLANSCRSHCYPCGRHRSDLLPSPRWL